MLDCTGWRCLAVPFSVWLAFNLAFGLLAFLMVYFEVRGGGGRSGEAQVTDTGQRAGPVARQSASLMHASANAYPRYL